MHKTPSPLAKQSIAVALCVETLEQQKFQVESVYITPELSIINIKYTPAVTKLNGIQRGIIGGKGGYFFLREIQLHGVHVQWLAPYFDAQQPKNRRAN